MDGENEEIGLFEELFQTILKMQPDMPEAMKINHFCSQLQKGALQTFRNINASNKRTLDDVLIILRQKYVTPQSQATANTNGINSHSILTQRQSQISLRN